MASDHDNQYILDKAAAGFYDDLGSGRCIGNITKIAQQAACRKEVVLVADFADKSRLGRVALGSSLAVAALILAGGIINLIRPVYFEAAIAMASLLIFVWVQFFLNRGTRLRNPPGMQICISILAFMSVFLGRFFSLYKNLPGFDKSQHFLYGMFFAVFGFILLYRLNPGLRNSQAFSPVSIIVFLSCFALTCGFLWEIFEFVNDRLFDTNMQAWKQGLAHGVTDTMLDMLADLAGGFLIGTIGVRKMNRDPEGFYERYLASFLSGLQPLPAEVPDDRQD